MARDATAMVRIPGVAMEVHILFGKGEMTREAMIRESEAFLFHYRDYGFLKIQFADAQATLNLPNSMPEGIPNRGIWASAKGRLNGTGVRYGELIRIRGNAVLRIRDGFVIQSIVMQGENPFVLSVEGLTGEFVHLGLVYDYRRNKALFIDASAVVPRGDWDAAFAKRMVQHAQRTFQLPLGANVTLSEDRFYSFTAQFVHSLLFDLDAPPKDGDLSSVRRAECGVGPTGRGFCGADRPTPGGRELIQF